MMKKFIISSLIVSSILLSGVQAFATTNPNIQDNQDITSGRVKRDIPSRRVVKTNKGHVSSWSTYDTTYNSQIRREGAIMVVNGVKRTVNVDVKYVTPIYQQKRTVELITTYEYLAGGSPTGQYFTETTEMEETREIEGTTKKYYPSGTSPIE